LPEARGKKDWKKESMNVPLEIVEIIKDVEPGMVLVLYKVESGEYRLKVETLQDAIVEEARDQGLSAIVSRRIFLRVDGL
jgi:hypothetical protein